MKRWMLAWVGAPLLAIVNGGVREMLYKDPLGEDAAGAVSTATLLALLGLYIWLLEQRWPLRGQRDALTIGAAWAALAVGFEFGFGHWVEGDSWSTLLANYDVTAGKTWVAVPLAIIALPELARRLATRGLVGPRHARTA